MHIIILHREGMRHINGAYTSYFNAKHKRRGHLFQGRYKAILVEADSYAGELSRYIHLNPVRAGMAALPEKYSWSSYRYYIGKNKKLDWLMVDCILDYFHSDNKQARKRYRKFVSAGVNVKAESPLEKTIASTMLGSDDFIELIKDTYLDHKERDRDVPAVRVFKESPGMTETYKKISAHCNGDTALAKKITIHLFHKYSEKKLRDIGRFFRIGESAVSDASRRFGMILKRNRKLRKKIESMQVQLNFCNA